jgi:hypothetical protein
MEEDRYTRITLRLPKELHARLEEAADATSKSLNAEIVGRLDASFSGTVTAPMESLMLEMRRTQLHLKLNTLKAELGALWNRGQELRQAMKPDSTPQEIRNLQDAQTAIKKAKQEIDTQSREVLARLAEIDQIDRVTAAVDLTHPASPSEHAAFTRDALLTGLDAYQQVVHRREEPISPKATSRGPTRSPNARKPKL